MNESTDFAYAAGYIDGDGCFYIGKIKTSPFYQDTFSIISTDLENIEWFNTHFKGNINVKSTRQKNRIPSYHFVFNKEGLKDLKFIAPYLVEKRQECEVFLKFRDPSFKDIRDVLVDSMFILKNETNLIYINPKQQIESLRNTIQPTIEDFAYLAGFIDAECSLDITRRIQKGSKFPSYRNQLQCNNTKYPFFIWASQRFGGQFHFLDKSHIPNARNQLLWRMSSKQLIPILENVFPFLKHKKPNCEEMIKLHKLTYVRNGSPSPNSPHFYDFYLPIFNARQEIYYKVRHLNKTII